MIAMNKLNFDIDDFRNQVECGDASEVLSVTHLLASQFTEQATVKWSQTDVQNVLFTIKRGVQSLPELTESYNEKFGADWPDFSGLVSNIEEITERAVRALGVLLGLFGDLRLVPLDNRAICAVLHSLANDLAKAIQLVADYTADMEQQEAQS